MIQIGQYININDSLFEVVNIEDDHIYLHDFSEGGKVFRNTNKVLIDGIECVKSSFTYCLLMVQNGYFKLIE